MEPTDWEIAYCYSSYFVEPFDDHVALLDLAWHLVTSGLCSIAYHSSDLVFSRSEDGSAKMDSVNFDWGQEGAKNILRLPKGLDDFQKKCVMEGGLKSYYEKSLLSDPVYYEAPYVRGFCKPLVMEANDEEIVLYPQVKVYWNGVVLLLFRRVARDRPVSVDDFVEAELNLARRGTTQIRVSPDVLKLVTQHTVYHETNPILNLGDDDYVYLSRDTIAGRTKLLEIGQKTEATIDAHTRVSNVDGFPVALSPIDPTQSLFHPELTLQTLHGYYLDALESVVNKVPDNLRFRIFGPSSKTHTQGGYWSARPKVFIHNFGERPSDASTIEVKFRSDVAKILARAPTGRIEVLDESVLTSKRFFDDFAMFLSEGVDLWVYTDKTFDVENGKEDVAYEMPTLSHQIQGEFIEYIHLSYRRLEEVSTSGGTGYVELQKERERMIGLDRLILKPAQYGELNQMFAAATSQLGIEEVRRSIKDGFSLRGDVLKDQRQARFRQFGFAIAVIFGILGATGLAIEVILPFLQSQSWEAAFGNSGLRLLSFAIGAASVLMLVLFIWSLTRAE